VVAKSPADGATGVLRNARVTATFDRDLDPATMVSPATGFSLDAGAGVVPATVAWDPVSKTATLTVSSPLPATTTVTAHVSSSVKDLGGIAVSADIHWSFQTGSVSDTAAPTFAGIVAATKNSNGTAALSWAAASDDFTAPSSIVYRAYESTSLSTVIAFVTGATQLATPSLAPGNWKFTVRAVDDVGNEDTNTASSAITIPFVHFSADVLPLLVPTCALAECHANVAASGLDLTASAAYGNLVNVASQEQPALSRVKPGNASHSYLYLKLKGDPSITGSSMPSGGGTPFTAAQLTTIRSWILEGAPND
jgi:hypothetical protein